ncbi:SEC-C motif-containing protein [Clavibacter michiganensis]|uniref:YchJ family protein n=1 Tax=Clavibacter michiganensis TaxID=28447 RepID=UPI00195C309B|nr:YchJ family metal-binding protein [Clavibacter michiganensis]MBM7411006.1 SEC-C motif-containing protein [Clavibacter michiganensis]
MTRLCPDAPWSTPDDDAWCPCTSGDPYGTCCGPLHRGDAEAPTAERLMRSRFAAYSRGDAAYLARSWHASTRPGEIDLDPSVRWFRLTIHRTALGGPDDATGVVEFEAAFRQGGERGGQREASRFVRQAGSWVYLDAL